MTNQKLRDDMMCLRGHLASLKFPTTSEIPTAYYDLTDNIFEQYDSILSRIYSDFKDD